MHRPIIRDLKATRLGFGLTVLLLFALSACDGGTDAPVPAQVQVTPQSTTLVGPGAEQQFAARVLDGSGKRISGVKVTWSTTAPAVITVDTSGLVTAQAEGTAEVRASTGGVTGFASVSVVPANDCLVPVSLAQGESLVQDAAGTSGCDLLLPSGSPGDRYRVGIVWPSSDHDNTDVADVTLVVTGVGGVVGELPSSPLRTASDLRDPLPTELVRGVVEDALRAESNGEAHRQLREMERQMLPRLARAQRENGAVLGIALEQGPVLAPSPDRWVYDPRVDSSCDAGAPRVARLVAENDYLAIYQDSIQAASTPADGFAVQQVLDYFQDVGLEVMNNYFGGVPDIDGDGRLRAVIAPVVDSKNAVAFVWSGDMFPKESCAQSNEMDLVYLALTLVNELTETPPAQRQTFQALATIVHEAKHVSSLWNGVKGAVEGGLARGLHPSWMEEGTAEIAAEVSSRIAWERAGGPARTDRVNEQDFRDSPGVFNADNYGVVLRLARMIAYMAGRPNGLMNLSVQQTSPSNLGWGSIYGSGWHFHRFLGDHYGNAATSAGADAGFFTSQNAETSTPGVVGIEALTGRSYTLVFLEYAEAVLGHSVGLGTRPVDFTTYDFLASEILCSDNSQSPYSVLGRYPWPLTVTGTAGSCSTPEVVEESKSFASGTYTGKLGPSGIQFLDLVSNGTGDGAEITAVLSAGVPAKWVVVRVD